MNPKQIRLSKKPRSIKKGEIADTAPLWVSEFMRLLALFFLLKFTFRICGRANLIVKKSNADCKTGYDKTQ